MSGANDSGSRLAARSGFFLAGSLTAAGAVYAVGVAWLASTGNLSPRSFSSGAQTAVGVATLFIAQLVLALIVCVDRSLQLERRLFSLLAVAFTACFTVTVSINRFVQLAVVRPAQLSGDLDQLSRFLPYERESVMFALEILGWGVFLSLAVLALAPAFRESRLEAAIRWSSVAYGILGIAGAAGYALRSSLFGLGFVAWGFVLYVWSALLTAWFWRLARAPESPAGSELKP